MLADIVKKHLDSGLDHEEPDLCSMNTKNGFVRLLSDFSIVIINDNEIIAQKSHTGNIQFCHVLLDNSQLEKESFFTLFMKSESYNRLVSDPETLNNINKQSVPFFYMEPTPQDSAEMDINSVYLFQNGDVIIQDKQTLEHSFIHSDKNTEKFIDSMLNGHLDLFTIYLKNRANSENKLFLDKGGKLAEESKNTGIVDFIKNKIQTKSFNSVKKARP